MSGLCRETQLLFRNSEGVLMRAGYLIVCAMLLGTFLQAQQPLTPDQLGTAPLTRDGAGANKNSMTYGVNSSTAFDDKAPNATTAVNNLTSSIQPDISVSIERPRSNALVYYSPTYTYSSNIDAYNSVSQAAATKLEYRFSPRFSLQIRDAFSLTNNSYENLQAAGNLPSLGIIDRPNSSALGANLRSTTNQASADLIYRLGRHTSAGIGGTFVTLRYQNPNGAANGGSFDSRSWSGHAFYSQQLTPRYSFSVEYSAQNFSSQGLYSTLTHSVLGFWTVSPRQNISFSVFGGPESSQFNDPPSLLNPATLAKQTSTGFSGGGNLSWQGEHNGLNASFVQRVSDGGVGGGAAVESRTASLALQRRLTSRLTTALFANYVSNSQIDPLYAQPDLSSISGGMGLSRMITPHWSINLSAFHQAFLGNSPQLLAQPDHDVVTASISYSFARPIGR
jgi:hypothetical protein